MSGPAANGSGHRAVPGRRRSATPGWSRCTPAWTSPPRSYTRLGLAETGRITERIRGELGITDEPAYRAAADR